MKSTRTVPLFCAPLFLVASLFFLPNAAHAAGLSDFMATIAKLSAQVKTLQTQLAALHPAPAPITITVGVPKTANFDERSYTSISSNPTFTGTANIEHVFIIIDNPEGKGMIGTSVPVTNGHWTYKSGIALAAGTYTVELFGGDTVVTRHVTVTAH